MPFKLLLRRMIVLFNPRLIAKYLSVSVGMYLAIFFLMYLLVDLIGMPKLSAYIITYLFAYLADYLINLKYLFQKDFSY